MYTWTLKIMCTCLIIMCTTFTSFAFFVHMYATISIIHMYTHGCAQFFLLSTYEIMIEIRKFIYFFFRNLFIIERSCNHWPINSKVYIFTIPTKRFLCHTSKFFCTHVRHNLYCTHVDSQMCTIFFFVDI